MKTPLKFVLALSAFGISIASLTNAFAQPQLVTLGVRSGQSVTNYTVVTNQVVQITSFAGSPVVPQVTLYHLSGVAGVTTNSGSFTGLTNVSVTASSYQPSFGGPLLAPGLVTLTIFTASASTMIPVNTVVIPSDATGPVQIILESSADLVNWTSALPGTYGTSATNRFFRVRAVANP